MVKTSVLENGCNAKRNGREDCNRMTDDRLNNKKIIVTGASSGIGAQLAKEIAKAGGKPILIARSADKLGELCKTIYRDYQIDCPVYPLDLKSEAAVQSTAEVIFEDNGEINALINNAGAGRFAGIQEFSMGEIEDVFSLNVKALMQMTMLYLNQFSSTQGDGHIINIASQAGKLATPKSAVYAASKHAVLGFSNALRMELAPIGIHLTTVNLGPVNTNFFDNADPSGKYRQSVRRYMLDPHKVAQKIVKNLFKKKREINLPWWMEAASRMHGIAPRFLETMLKKQFNKK
ncbi:SDR family NAD(P)-dependent oxidoreductase [Virgibacillus halophilus]